MEVIKWSNLSPQLKQIAALVKAIAAIGTTSLVLRKEYLFPLQAVLTLVISAIVPTKLFPELLILRRRDRNSCGTKGHYKD